MGGDVSRSTIRFRIEDLGDAEGQLVRYQAPRTVEALLRAMPIDGITALAERMVYFGIPIKLGTEKPKTKIEAGTLAYWPMGSAFCIFLDSVEPYSPVNLIGKVTQNLDIFSRAGSGRRIRVEMIS